MPTTATNTYSTDRLVPVYSPEEAKRIEVKLPASIAYAKGTILGEVTATPGTFKAYATAAGDGSGVAKLILEYACATDASGNITFGTTAVGGPFGETRLTAPAYYKGTFKTAELVQSGAGAIDADAVADLNAHLVSGTLADGVIQIG